MTIRRRVYWSAAGGSVVPVDGWLGIAASRHSPGVRELCCREACGVTFRRAAENLGRAAQLSLSHETVRQVVEGEARAIRPSACGLSQRMPRPFSRPVSVLQKASVGPEPMSQPWARHLG